MAAPMNPVTWFEIPVDDLDRARAFYEYVLGVQLTVQEMPLAKMAWFPMAENAPGAAGTLMKADVYKPATIGTVVYFSVQDIEATLARVNEKRGKTLAPKTSIGPYGFIAHFQDCEGNRVALHAMT